MALVGALSSSSGSGVMELSKAASNKRKNTTPLEKYEKEAMQHIRDYLVSHRDQILVVKEKLERGQFIGKKTKDEDAKEKPTFDSSYMTFRQIPKYFFGDVLVSLCNFSVEQVDLINSKDRQAIRYMATLFFGVHDTDYLPRPCLQKSVLSVFLLNRGIALGRRWEGWASKCVDGQGEIDWNKGGTYTLVWGRRPAGSRRSSTPRPSRRRLWVFVGSHPVRVCPTPEGYPPKLDVTRHVSNFMNL